MESALNHFLQIKTLRNVKIKQKNLLKEQKKFPLTLNILKMKWVEIIKLSEIILPVGRKIF